MSGGSSTEWTKKPSQWSAIDGSSSSQSWSGSCPAWWPAQGSQLDTWPVLTAKPFLSHSLLTSYRSSLSYNVLLTLIGHHNVFLSMYEQSIVLLTHASMAWPWQFHGIRSCPWLSPAPTHIASSRWPAPLAGCSSSGVTTLPSKHVAMVLFGTF